jgi:Domain of unknown function (DUF4062)/VHL beta domain
MKVFLSSTFVDLQQHLRAATAALERLGQQVGGMEILGALTQEPTTACAHEIEDSELFVGIYAHRYGFIPAGSDVSITEQEFDVARSAKKSTFCFLISDEHPWPPKMIEGGHGWAKLDAFKQRLSATLVIEYFTTSEDLAFRVAAAVGRYLAGAASGVANSRPPNAPEILPELKKAPRSLDASNSVTLEFRNRSQRVYRLYWINYQGLPVLYATLNPNQYHTQPTYITHPWLITDENDNFVKLHYPEYTATKVDL